MKLTIIGASGHGKVVADIAGLNGYDEIEFLDDNTELHSCGKWTVIGTSELAAETDHDLFIAIGSAAVRERLMERFQDKHIVTLIHPSAVIAEDVEIDVGSVVMAGAIINPGTRIGKGCIINTSCSVDHDCTLEDYVHVAVGSHLAGTVSVGKGTWIGAGATVSNNISICEGCMIGAGSVVIYDITDMGTYVGIPAKMVKKN